VGQVEIKMLPLMMIVIYSGEKCLDVVSFKGANFSPPALVTIRSGYGR
jgi:hypothetical protein